MPNLILKSLGVGMRVWGAIAVIVLLHVSAVRADTLNDALAGAYARNPRLNAERARLRATDENVPQALAGYRPQLNAGLSAGLQGVRNLLPGGEALGDQLRERQSARC